MQQLWTNFAKTGVPHADGSLFTGGKSSESTQPADWPTDDGQPYQWPPGNGSPMGGPVVTSQASL